MVGTAGAIIITILVLAAVAAIGWVLYSRWNAQRLGLPPPSITTFIPFLNKSDSSPYGAPTPRSGGVQGWFGDQVRKFKDRNNRTAAGAYEGAPPQSRAGGGRRGFGPLDPDEAWDARVGNEADHYGPGGYYEEQELGLHPQGPYGSQSHHAADEDTSYGGGLGVQQHQHDTYPMNLAATPGLPPPQHEERGRSREPTGGRNPFDDDAAEPSNISMRGVSPRPMNTDSHGHKVTGDNVSERRSIFTEQV